MHFAASRCSLVLASIIVVLGFTASAGTGPLVSNQLPNPEFRGNQGALVVNVTGEVPSLWRTFAVEDAAASMAVVPVAANDLFPGSPAVNAVELTVTDFGTPGSADAGFDNSPNRFTMLPGRPYTATVWLRSTNSDMSDQSVSLSRLVFDAGGTFTGDFVTDTVIASTAWTRFDIPPFATALVGASGELAFRLNNSGSENQVQIALPTVEGPTLENRVPNPQFSGTGGIPVENVTGTVPDLWRAFALDSESAALSLETVQVPADELFPGSPPTTAIRINSVNVLGAGFDHEITQVPLAPAGRIMWAEVYMRSDNADNSPQDVLFSMPIFDSGGGFTGNAPGSVNVTATTQWQYFAGIPFAGQAGETTNVSFRLQDSGTENTVLIAMPRLNGLSDSLFDDSFEGADPP